MEVFLDKRVRETRQRAGANSRRGATKKRKISRTLLSINLHFSVDDFKSVGGCGEEQYGTTSRRARRMTEIITFVPERGGRRSRACRKITFGPCISFSQRGQRHPLLCPYCRENQVKATLDFLSDLVYIMTVHSPAFERDRRQRQEVLTLLKLHYPSIQGVKQTTKGF